MATEIDYPHIREFEAEPATLARHPRIRIAQLALDYLAHGWSAEEMCRQHEYLSLSEAHAALLYYWDHREEVQGENQGRPVVPLMMDVHVPRLITVDWSGTIEHIPFRGRMGLFDRDLNPWRHPARSDTITVRERSRRSSRPREASGGAAQWASTSGLVEAPRVSTPPALAAEAVRHASNPPRTRGGRNDPMRTDKDLFAEETEMVSMSFGDHIEDLRYRLVLGLIGLFVGMVVTFIPLPVLGQSIGSYVFNTMARPAQDTLDKFYKDQATRMSTEAREVKKLSPTVLNHIPAKDFVEQVARIAPKLGPMLPDPNSESLRGQTVDLPLTAEAGDLILNNQTLTFRSALVSLAPLETITIYFMICMVSGLVLTSPFVFYQVWAFIAAGLYRHERHYVKKFLPFSLGLFLAGVFLCFFGVLPYTLMFLLQFNVWLGIEPTMRLTDWMSFATILPVVFGVSFQTPLVMLFLERIGILTGEDFRKKRKIAVLVIVAAAAILTPGPDVFSQLALAIPMVGLYELGLIMIDSNKPKKVAAVS